MKFCFYSIILLKFFSITIEIGEILCIIISAYDSEMSNCGKSDLFVTVRVDSI